MVAVIDIGTVFSSYAYTLRSELDVSVTNIHAPTWQADEYLSVKNSTCVLFDHRKNFHSFGYEAEATFMDLVEEKKHKDWYYFRRFKMKLYDTMVSSFCVVSDKYDQCFVNC